MAEPITRVRLFVPGTPASEEAWSAALRRGGLRLEGGTLHGSSIEEAVGVDYVANDGTFGSAFSFGTVPPDGVKGIDRAPGALVVYLPVDLREGRAQVVALVERLRDAGALAVRLEQSKLGWEISRWLELVSSKYPWDWHRATVVFLGDAKVIQSCGMHAFSLPDARVPVEGDEADAQHLASILNVYQIEEDPLLFSGQTFRPDSAAPRRVVERWPDMQYEPSHPCHNPYGVWRLGPPGGKWRGASDPLPVPVPALHVMLGALEKKNGAPLSRQQVEAARDGAVCIAMPQRDAQRFERARGYADLDLELVWEQWQLVRERGG